jgi:hypothetical protein
LSPESAHSSGRKKRKNSLYFLLLLVPQEEDNRESWIHLDKTSERKNLCESRGNKKKKVSERVS